jgi:glycosyltransferase involved in cell wall biosynthesis
MNILIVVYWHDPNFKKKPGGLIRMYELADNLICLGHDVTLMVPDMGFPKTQTRAKVVAVPFLDLPIIRPLSFHLFSTLCLFTICMKGVDRMYVRQMNSFLPLLIAKLYSISSYFEIPNDPYIGYSSVNKYKQWLVKLIDKVCMCLCDRVVVLSEWSKKRINTFGVIPLSKILVFPSGTDTDLFHPMEKEDCCLKIGLDPSCHYVGFIGSFLAYQGIDTLIDAAPLILKKVPNTRFLLVGDGPMRADLEKKVQGKGLQNYFIFTGHVPYRDVPDYIGAMDVCVAPHQGETNQSSPVKLFDYMASGRSIVASDIDVVREIVADSGCAVLIAPGHVQGLTEGIVSLLENPSVMRELGNRGRRFAMEHYDRKLLTINLFSSLTIDG